MKGQGVACKASRFLCERIFVFERKTLNLRCKMNRRVPENGFQTHCGNVGKCTRRPAGPSDKGAAEEEKDIISYMETVKFDELQLDEKLSVLLRKWDLRRHHRSRPRQFRLPWKAGT